MRKLCVVLLAIVTLASCQKMKQPQFIGVQDLKIKEATLGKSQVVLSIKFFNPNSFNARVKYAEGEAWIDSSYLGPFVVDEKVMIPAKSEFVVPVTLTMDMKKFAIQSLTLFNKKEVTIKATGTLRAGRSGIYKTVPVHYEGKQDLQKLMQEAMNKTSATK
jgi:LEA14-like dessication related protein